MRHSVLVTDEREIPTGLCRSKSATALKTMDAGVGEEDFSTLCRLFLIAVAMLESNFDNEYLLALHLLDKVTLNILQCYMRRGRILDHGEEGL